MQAAQSAVAPLRRLVWQASVPLEIRLAQGEGEPQSGGGIEKYYLQAPRYAFLPFLLKEIRENFVELAMHEEDLEKYREADWWFEEDRGDETTLNEAAREPWRWHWSIDLIHMHAQLARRLPSTPTGSALTAPLCGILHLTPPPPAIRERLLASSLDALKAQHMTALKEADHVRWGHTRRITGMRRGDLENGWRALVEGDYEAHSRFASRLLPLPFTPSAGESSAATSSGGSGTPSRPASTDPGGTGGVGNSALSSGSGKPDPVYASRAIPLRIYLPDGVPFLQELVPPLDSENRPTTLISVLRQHLPLLFPSSPSPNNPYPLAVPLLQGAILPPETDLGWLSCAACAPDGWLRVGVQLRGD